MRTVPLRFDKRTSQVNEQSAWKQTHRITSGITKGENKQNSSLCRCYVTFMSIVIKAGSRRDNVPGLLRNKEHCFQGLSTGRITFNDLKIVSDVTDNIHVIHIYQNIKIIVFMYFKTRYIKHRRNIS